MVYDIFVVITAQFFIDWILQTNFHLDLTTSLIFSSAVLFYTFPFFHEFLKGAARIKKFTFYCYSLFLGSQNEQKIIICISTIPHYHLSKSIQYSNRLLWNNLKGIKQKNKTFYMYQAMNYTIHWNTKLLYIRKVNENSGIKRKFSKWLVISLSVMVIYKSICAVLNKNT